MTDSEIIKALEVCTTTGASCKNCPAYVKVDCSNCKEAFRGALALIKRQKAEIEQLKSDVSTSRNAYMFMEDRYEYEKEKVAKAKQKVIDVCKLLKTAKTEAVKEFAEEIENALESNYEVRRKRMEKYGSEHDEFLSYVDGKIDCLRGLQGFLKEMVGENDA